MRSTVLTMSNILAFSAGLLIGVWSWLGSPPAFATKVLSLASGIGWLFVLSLLATVIAFLVGFIESEFGHHARSFHAWLHRHVAVRQQRAIFFLVGLIVCPMLATAIAGESSYFEVIALTLILMLTFGFYGYGLNAMADRLRVRGYLSDN